MLQMQHATHMWSSPTKQGASLTDLFWDMKDWSWVIKNNTCLFWDFSKSHIQRNHLWFYTQMVISQKVGVWTIPPPIKLKLDVCSLLWYQNLSLPKMSLVPSCRSASQLWILISGAVSTKSGLGKSALIYICALMAGAVVALHHFVWMV